ncbi:hypothetical protein VSR82_07385 [Burkholderia sp. JPY481]|uniref:hypothetical protein n=1 Tax=Paraburkholderia sp. JPY465 TaxID=3042285 RepID=UPI0031765CD6
MAPKASDISSFQIFEGVVIRLYDGGVLSPAVLERVVGAFAQANVDWRGTVQGRSVDGRSLHEIVALTMLPGQPLRSASASFMSVIEHIAGVASQAEPKPARRGRKAVPPADETEAETQAETRTETAAESQELLAQLSGNEPSGKRRRANQQPDRPASPHGYNPFVNARPPRTKKP